MREGFRNIISGWMLVDDFDRLTDRIEQAATWTEVNGPLEPDEANIIEIMIRTQIRWGMPELAHLLPGPRIDIDSDHTKEREC